MKFGPLKYGWTVALGLFLSLAHDASAITLSFSNVSGAEIAFNGSADSFQFNDGAGGRDFSINSSSGGGTAMNLEGNIGGVFHIGAITTSGFTQTAPVTGTGTFSIFDGVTSLTADISWISIYTQGTAGGLNAGGSLNLANVLYSGTNADLQTLFSEVSRDATISFTFVPALSLTDLTTDGATNETSYNGTVTGKETLRVPEGGSALAMLGLALLGLEGLRRKASAKKA